MTLDTRNSNLDGSPTRGRLGRNRRSRDEIEELIDRLVNDDVRGPEQPRAGYDTKDELREVLEQHNSKNRLE